MSQFSCEKNSQLKTTKGAINMEENVPVKVIYKKQIMVELVRKNHNLLYTTRNRNNRKYQCYMFELTPELEKDLAELTGHEYVESKVN